jgi:putative heme-binding domain-containing protein
LVYLINGSDTGWRINWQFGKYTDPKNNDYKVWMNENMHVPHQQGQAAYFLPPITNYVNGPTGMVYNPGTALGEKWHEHFFVAEFRGTPVNSPLHAFTLKPRGAGFELDHTQEVVRGVLPTGVDFGPDGALYFSDWIDGWNPKGQGRIWKLDVAGGSSDPLRSEVQSLLAGEFSDFSGQELLGYLSHRDMRVRQKAQFELADRGRKGLDILEQALQEEDQLARIHGIWGIGQIARKENLKHAASLSALLQDQDPEIITQAVKTLGDIRYGESADKIVPLLNHESLRVQMHATEALGRLSHVPAFQAMVDMIEKNNDQDIWLRHAGMIALSRLGDEDALSALNDHPSKSVRLAAVVALRRMKSPAISTYLSDRHEDVVTEAARGINDDLGIEEALPALASVLSESPFKNEALIRRAINANQRIGQQSNIEVLIDYVQQESAPAAMRGEALRTLSHWGSPSAFDRVDGRFIGTVERDDSYVKHQLGPIIANLLKSKDDTVQLEAARASGKLKLLDSEPTLLALARNHPNPAIRSTALQALSELPSDQLNRALEAAFKDRDTEVRSTALAILPESNISEDQAVALFDQIMNSGTYREQQVVLAALGEMKSANAISSVSQYLGWLETGKASPEIKLDILEAVKQQDDEALMAQLDVYEKSKPSDDPLSPYLETLYGGDSRSGREIFRNHEAAQCIRCHTIFETGGTMGPGLSGVGSKYTAEALLLALVEPSSSFAEGYHMVTLKLSGGETLTGLVQDETDQSITVKSGNQEAQEISKADIAEQTSIPSSMPPMGAILTKKEIRDVLAYLVTLDE